MLMPKRMKYRKQHRGRMTGTESRGAKVDFGDLDFRRSNPPGYLPVKSRRHDALSCVICAAEVAIGPDLPGQADHEQAR